MKILNLYAGIGGNRKLWGDEHEITAVEINPDIAKIYKDFYPNDNVILEDAHDFLLKHFREFDFIWTSPPCQTHSLAFLGNINKPIFKYPDMKLWQEIVLLRSLFKGKYVVENVKPYYKPILEPTFSIGRHFFWSSNFMLAPGIQQNLVEIWESVDKMSKAYKVDLTNYKLDYKFKRQILRNMVVPEIGKYIFENIIKT